MVRLNYPFQKMSEWVAVCADEAEEPVEIPTEADGEPFGLIEHVKSGLGVAKQQQLVNIVLKYPPRIDAVDFGHGSVSWSHRVEVPQPLDQHCEGGEDAGGGEEQVIRFFSILQLDIV